MFCGTGSDVGKSVLTAGFCRILSNRGISVAPFKSQNMALNSFATPEGGEIGRAQAVQAQACRIPPHTDMNPVLLKPNSDTGSQVIVQGKAVGNMAVRNTTPTSRRLSARWGRASRGFRQTSLHRHRRRREHCRDQSEGPRHRQPEGRGDGRLSLHSGGGHRPGRGFCPDRRHLELLEPEERERIKGIIINKFRGDPSLLTSGIEFVEKRTGVPVLGVVPYFRHFRIPEEDSVALEKRRSEARGTRSEEGTIRSA